MREKGSPRFAVEAGLVPILIVLILAALVGGYFIFQNQPKPITTPSPQPSSSPTDETANWKTYTNTKYSLQFSYPPGWRIIYDKQPDPSGNPTKYSVVIEKDSNTSLIATMLRSDQYQTFESLSNILNLPSESASITNRKEIVVDGRKALYVIQNNSKEGIITLDPKNNLIILEVNSKDKTIFDQILSTFKFTN